jgi:ketosteroid isomerase-like protein
MRPRTLAIALSLLAPAATALCSAKPMSARAATAERTIWNLEHAYWRFVERGDLTDYSNLWAMDFLGWPADSPTPVGKAGITDWITTEMRKGWKFKVTRFQPAAIEDAGPVISVCYWVRGEWLDKKGERAGGFTSRITHTWLRSGNRWSIVSGMSMRVPESALPAMTP